MSLLETIIFIRKILFYITFAIALHLGFKMTESSLPQETPANNRVEAVLSAHAGDMMVPHLVNQVTVPAIHFTSARKIQKNTNNTLTIKRLSSYFKTFSFKNQLQILYCFVSKNDRFEVILRHLII